MLVYGKYTLLDKDNPNVYAYVREYQNEKMLIVLNFSSSNAKTNIGINISNAKVLLSNYKNDSANNIDETTILLKPYESIIYKL